MNQIEITQSAERVLRHLLQEMTEGLTRKDVHVLIPGIDDVDAELITEKIRQCGQARIIGRPRQ